jgi:cytochrome c oxidase accessory protein FixG
MSALVFADFAWFREQLCSLACPYARLQSALLDPQSAVVAYDAGRGEPRAAPRDRKSGGTFGDCVDCSACVIVCPAGIDIRKGLQLECIACAQCADACDTVMRKRDRPLGLIGYEIPAPRAAIMRPRVWIYAAILIVTVAAFTLLARLDRSLEVDVIGSPGAPFLVLANGEIGTPMRLRLANQGRAARAIEVRIDAGTLVISENPVRLAPGESRTLSIMVRTPRAEVASGSATRSLSFVEEGAVRSVEPIAITGPIGGAP